MVLASLPNHWCTLGAHAGARWRATQESVSWVVFFFFCVTISTKTWPTPGALLALTKTNSCVSSEPSPRWRLIRGLRRQVAKRAYDVLVEEAQASVYSAGARAGQPSIKLVGGASFSGHCQPQKQLVPESRNGGQRWVGNSFDHVGSEFKAV